MLRFARLYWAAPAAILFLVSPTTAHDGRGGPNIARNELAVLHATFTEGRDTADLRAAKRYLESTAPSA